MTKEELISFLKQARETVSDEVALNSIELYPQWTIDKNYMVGDRVIYQSLMYKCLQTHISQSTWTPTATPSLWAKVLIPNPDVIPEWEQPESTNPYQIGDKVSHNGKIWVCNTANNVWEPGVYGWDEVTE